MPKPHPVELRRRVVAAVIEDGDTYDQAAARFKVGRASVNRWVQLAKRGDVRPKPGTNGMEHTIRDDLLEQLRRLVLEHRDDTLSEHRDRFEEQTGVSVSVATIGRAVHRLRLSRKKRRSKPKSASPSE